MSGQQMGGRYVLEREIAGGGMGAIWVALDRQLQRRVALKLMTPRPRVLARGARQPVRARGAWPSPSSSNPHVVQIYDYGVDDGRARTSSWSCSRARIWRRASSGAAGSARRRGGAAAQPGGQGARPPRTRAGIVHRDLKPANFFLARERRRGDGQGPRLRRGRCWLRSGDAPPAAQARRLVGTPALHEPRADARPTRRSTTAAISGRSRVVAYRALTGQLPFDADAVGELLQRQIRTARRAAPRSSCPSWARRWIASSSGPWPRIRRGASPPRASWPPPSPRWCERRPARPARQDPGRRRRAGRGAADAAALPPADPRGRLRVRLRRATARRRWSSCASTPTSTSSSPTSTCRGWTGSPSSSRVGEVQPARQGRHRLGLQRHEQHPHGDEPRRVRLPRQAHRLQGPRGHAGQDAQARARAAPDGCAPPRRTSILRMFVHGGIVERVLAAGARARALAGETVEATVAFIDVKDFTPVTAQRAARGRPPQAQRQLRGHRPRADRARRRGGQVRRRRGDGRVPRRGPRWSGRSTPASSARAAAARHGLPRRRAGRPTRTASASAWTRASCVSGSIGAQALGRLDYTVLGDVVNTAARLASLAARDQLLIGEHLRQRVEARFECQPAGERRLPGARRGAARPRRRPPAGWGARARRRLPPATGPQEVRAPPQVALLAARAELKQLSIIRAVPGPRNPESATQPLNR